MTDSDTPETTPADEPAVETTPEAVTAAPAEAAPEAVAEVAVETPAETPAVADTPAIAEAETVDSSDETAEDAAAADETPAEPAVVAPPLRNVDARNPIWTVGRRKASTARIRMFPGGGNFMVNGKPLDEFFRLVQDQRSATQPLDHAGLRKTYDVWVNVHGGGTTGQAGAISLGVARALIQLLPACEQSLRDESLLRRDARVKERKKYGRRGARRGFQFSKR